MSDDATMTMKIEQYQARIEGIIKKLKPKPAPTLPTPTHVVETKPSMRCAKPPDLKIPTSKPR